MESELHRELVVDLVACAERAGMEILAADGVPGHRRPWRIGVHHPDMIARDPHGRLVCGEANAATNSSGATFDSSCTNAGLSIGRLSAPAWDEPQSDTAPDVARLHGPAIAEACRPASATRRGSSEGA